MRSQFWLVALVAFLVVWAPCVVGQSPVLVAGGDFTLAGGVAANYVAQWNGVTWSALGGGTPFSKVQALTVSNNQLVAGGDYGVAQWDGSAWTDLGRISGQVFALTVFNTQPVVGGGFTNAGDVSVNYIAQWNGAAWLALGSGMSGSFSCVYELTVFNNQLVAGGGFTTAGGVSANNIARWNGVAWSALGSGVNNLVFALTVFNSKLVAGGDFTNAGGVAVNRIAQWDGTAWSGLGSGMNQRVVAFTVFNYKLVAGGFFTTAGGISANRIAQWDSSAWSALGSGLSDTVRTLTLFNNQLVAGGDFNNVAQWNGVSWSALSSGMNAMVWSLAVYTPAPIDYSCNCTGCPTLTLRARQYGLVSPPTCSVGYYMAISPSIESTTGDAFRVYTVDDNNLKLFQNGSTFSYYVANSAPDPVSCFSTGRYNGDPKVAKLTVIMDCANPILACVLQYKVLYLCAPVTGTEDVMDDAKSMQITNLKVNATHDYVLLEAKEALQ